MNKLHYGIAGIIVLLILIAMSFIPVDQRRILTEGIDEYRYHVPLWSRSEQTQTVTINYPLSGVGAILVNLRKAALIPDVEVSVTDNEGTEYATGTIFQANIKDDTFAYVEFPEPLTNLPHDVRITFSAPEATAQNPIGIRFNPAQVAEAGTRWRNGEEQAGTLALALKERVPLWRGVITTLAQYPEQTHLGAGALFGAIVIALLATRRGWWLLPQHVRPYLPFIVLFLVAAGAVVIRIWVGDSLKGVSGGDPYNYLSIARALSEGNNPFAVDKRLPLFPLLLIPAYLTSLDDIWWMRLLSALAAGIVVVLVALLARRLKLPWSVQIVTAALLVFHKDFFWTSLRPEPYTVYTVLLLSALIFFFLLKHKLAQVFFGLSLGSAAMTRQEGFLLAALLGVCAIVLYKQLFVGVANQPIKPATQSIGERVVSFFWPIPWRELPLNLLRTFGPALLLVLPFFINNTLAYGNPLYTPYFEGERLQIVNSWEGFKDAGRATIDVITNMWRPSVDQLVNVVIEDPLVLKVAGLVMLWWLLHLTPISRHVVVRCVIGAAAIVLLVWSIGLATMHQRHFIDEILPHVTGGALLGSFLPFLWRCGWRGAVVVAVCLTQLLIALWFHPFAKHYQQAYPLLTLFLVTVLLAPVRKLTWGPWLTALIIIGTITPLFLSSWLLFSKMSLWVDRYNAATAQDYVVYQGVQAARGQPGPIGFDANYQQAHLYFRDKAAYFTAGSNPDPRKAEQWLHEKGIRTLIVTTVEDFTVFEPQPDWQLLYTVKSEGKNERLFESFVYELPVTESSAVIP